MQAKNRLLIWVCFLLPFVQLTAQGWERTYGNNNQDEFKDLIQLADGGYILVGKNGGPTDTLSDVWLMRTDSDGEMQWAQDFGIIFQEDRGNSVRQTLDGGYIIGGTSFPETNAKGYLIRTDILGNLLWETISTQDSVRGNMAIPLSDGSFVLVGSRQKPLVVGGDLMDRDGFLMRVDSLGNETDWAFFGGAAFDEFHAVVELGNGDLVMGGLTRSYGNCYQVFVVKVYADGSPASIKTYGGGEEDIAYDMIVSDDESQLLLTGKTGLCDANDSGDAFILKLDATTLDSISMISFPNSGVQVARGIHTTTDGLILTGVSQFNSFTPRDLFLYRLNASDNIIWSNNYGGISSDGGAAVLANLAGGFTAAGFTGSYGNGNFDAYLVQTDSWGNSLSSVIAGNVAYTENSCDPEFPDGFLANQIIQIEGPATYYTVTDENGDFSAQVQDGTYAISIPSISDYWDFCAAPTLQTVQGQTLGIFDTAMVYLTLKPETFAPLPRIDIGVNHLRPGFQSTYTLKYCNTGSTLALNTSLEVTLDEFLTYDTSSIPWINDNGNTYTFFLGDLDVFECGEFQIYATLDSTVTLGQTHCVEAHISPDSLIVNNPSWDGASIELDARCAPDSDSIHFEIINRGNGSMIAPLEYIIIEDQIIMLQGNFELGANESAWVTLESTGGTFRMEAEQSEHHPIESQPSIAVEGCGGLTPGQIINFPQNDASPFVDIDCRENTGSFDPNDKQAFPRGWGDENFIEANTDIEYLIRFQNEGTDTAFQVVIRDTISEFLDPASIVPMVGSHPYRYSVHGNGVLTFTFENILLPHKAIDSLGSMGFVRFRIKQRPDNPIGTEIFNTAAIYFDYNAPIITEPTYHQIGVMIDPSSTNTEYTEPSYLKIYPNPFSTTTTFDIENVGVGAFDFTIYDLQGRLLRREMINQPTFQFEKGQLLSGMYIFKIEQRGEILHTGKIVIR